MLTPQIRRTFEREFELRVLVVGDGGGVCVWCVRGVGAGGHDDRGDCRDRLVH